MSHGKKLIRLAVFCVFAGAATLNLSFAADAPYAYQSGRQVQIARVVPPPSARIVVVDPYYTPGNPNCYLKREVAASPYGPVLWYKPICR